MAEGEGFEPPRPFGLTVFKTAAIDHSANPPGQLLSSYSRKVSFKAKIELAIALDRAAIIRLY